MIKQTIVYLALIIFSGCIQKKNMDSYLNETRKIVKQGNYEEANKRYLWFFEHAAEKDPFINPVRLSFALFYWKSLADIYPPARKEMEYAHYQATKSALLGSIYAFEDAAALNRIFEQHSETVQLFNLIENKFPDRIWRFFPFAKEALFEKKQYSIIKKYLKNPLREYKESEQDFKVAIGISQKLPSDSSSVASEVLKADFVNRVLVLIDYCRAVGENNAANTIQQKSLQLVNDDRIRIALDKND